MHGQASLLWRVAFVAALLWHASGAWAQAGDDPFQKVPAELQPVDRSIRALLVAGSHEASRGNFEVAQSKYEQASAIAAKSGFRGDAGIAESWLAQMLFARGQWQDARQHYDAASRFAAEADNEVLAADVLTSLAQYPRASGDFKASLDLLFQAFAKAKSAKSLQLQSRAAGEIGGVLIASGRSSEAKPYLQTAIEIDETNGFPLLAMQLVYLAQATGADGNQGLDQAIALLERARKAAVSDDNYVALVLSCYELAQRYVRAGRSDEASRLLQSVTDGSIVGDDAPRRARLATTTKLPVLELTLLLAQDQIAKAKHNAGEHERLLMQVYDISARSGFREAHAEASYDLGRTRVAANNDTEALRYFDEAAQSASGTALSGRLVEIEGYRADTLFRLGRFEEALASVNRLRSLAHSSGNIVLEFRASVQAVRIASRIGQCNRATAFALEAQDLLPSIKPVDAAKTVAADRLALYVLSAHCHEQLHQPSEETIALANAALSSVETAHQETWQWLIPTFRKAVDALGGEQGALKAIAEGRYADGIALLVAIKNLQYAEAAWAGKPAPETAIKATIDQIADGVDKWLQNPAGAKQLQQALRTFGPIARSDRAFLTPLMRAYFRQQDFQAAFATAQQLLPLLAIEDGKRNSLLDVNDLCLAGRAAYMMQQFADAEKLAPRCVSNAEAIRDEAPDLVRFAYLLQAEVQQRSDASRAAAAVEKLIGVVPANGELQLELGRKYRTQGRTKDALAAVTRAREIFASQGNNSGIAAAELEIAELLDASRANERREKAEHLDAARRAINPERDFSLLRDLDIQLARIAISEKRIEDANRLAQQALAAADRSRDDRVIGLAHSEIGDLYQSLTRFADAAEEYSQAALNAERLKELSFAALQWTSAGRAFLSANRSDDALSALQRAERDCGEACDWRIRFFIRQTRLRCLRGRGDFEQAVRAGMEARDIAAAAGDELRAAWALMDTYPSLTLLGDWEQAASDVSTALSTFESRGERGSAFEALAALVGIYGDRRSEVRNFAKALDYYNRAELLAKDDPALDLESVREVVVEVYVQLNRAAEAVPIMERRLKRYEEESNNVGVAHALITMAELYRRLSNYKQAAGYLHRAEPLVAKQDDLYLTGRLVYAKAGYARDTGNLPESRDLYSQLVQMIEALRASVSGRHEQKFAEAYDFIYDEFVDVLSKIAVTDPSAASRALEVAEGNKARQFSLSWGRTFVHELSAKIPAELLERERKAIAAQVDSQSAGQQARLRGDATSQNENLTAVIAALRQAVPQYAAIKYPAPFRLDQIPSKTGETVVEFKVADDALYTWILTGDASRKHVQMFYRVSHDRQWLQAQISSVREAFDAGQPSRADLHIAERLFSELFPPNARSLLLSAKSLVIVPDDVLFMLPIELLSPTATAGEFPLAAIPTRYYPSLGAMIAGRAVTAERRWSSGFLGVSDPISPGEDRLPLTAVEVQSITTLFPNGSQTRVYTAETATKERLLQTDLMPFRFIHFATHGYITKHNGVEEPALVLSSQSKDRTGWLWMSDVLRMRLSAEMVVLSACSTGKGKVSRAEGVFNLGRAFLTAGAASSVVSLWPVADDSTAELMVDFYRNLLAGEDRADALAAARVGVMKRHGANPFYWAPFVLIGD